jgi:hypothetical protein
MKKEIIMAAASTKTKLVTGKVRLSFAHLFTPVAAMGSDKEKYSVSVIIPKSDTETINKFNKAFKEVAEANAAVFGGAVPKNLKGGLRDGDEEKDDEAYANSYFFNASSGQRPGVVDADMNEIIDPNEVYSGCYGRVSVTLYPYNTSGSKGVAYGLNNVQKLADGDRLGGGSSAAADFAI